MITQTTKIKEGKILLPPEARKDWKDAEVFVKTSEDTIVIKKIKKTPFWETWEKMRKAGKKITQEDIKNAVTWARRSQKQ